ncbi:MAG: hypothetical protein NVS2B17_20790 [Candidatus Velthaea sp.]
MLAFVLVMSAIVPARAARPLLDSGKWDAYFALFARDTQVPWKRISVRLDTYSGAPVEFAAYEVDPTDVLVAGSSARPRATDTSHRTPAARWRFTPPAGLKFESNDVDVPLANREGFFVVEARRGDAAQQVWLNLSRIGLLTKESPGGTTLYGADLGTGRALADMRVTYLVGTSFAYGKTDAHGIERVQTAQRPRFALAEWGRSRAFVNFVPVSPIAGALLGVRLDRGVVRAGEHVRAIGFVRRKAGNTMRVGTGEVKITVVAHGRTYVSASARLDAAGAFSADLPIPPSAPAGDVAVLATAAGATGGATLRVDGIGDAVLTIAAECGTACAPDAEVPIVVNAKHAGVPLANRDIRVRIVRTPHILAPGTPDDAPQWATTTIFDQLIKTDDLGVARLTIPAPTDGLASTYGLSAGSGASTATGRVVTPTAKIALAVTPERTQIDIGESAAVNVRGFDALDGAPAAGASVHVQLIHGPAVQDQTVKLDAEGRARVQFRNPVPGTNLATAETNVAGKRAFDAAAIVVVPSALSGSASQKSSDVRITLDRSRYRVGDRINLEAALAGAAGDAFITLEGARPFATQATAVRDGKATATLTVPETVGDAYAGVAFVRDGAMYYATQRIAIDGPGHQRLTALAADKTVYTPGATAKITISDGGIAGGSTLAIRLLDGRPARGAAFEDAPEVLAAAATTSQNPASDDPAWHAWVAPARSTAGDIFGFDRPRPKNVVDAAIAFAAPRALVWRVERTKGETFDVQLPEEAGKYVLSILKMTDDGDVGTATLSLTVQ